MKIQITRYSIEWYYVNGHNVLHSIRDIPASVDFERDEVKYIWYKHGNVHRDNLPASVIVNNNGILMVKYFQNDQMHRVDGPACIDRKFKIIAWYQNSAHHRENGPAVVADNFEGVKYAVYYSHGEESYDTGASTLLIHYILRYASIKHTPQETVRYSDMRRLIHINELIDSEFNKYLTELDNMKVF